MHSLYRLFICVVLAMFSDSLGPSLSLRIRSRLIDVVEGAMASLLDAIATLIRFAKWIGVLNEKKEHNIWLFSVISV